MTCPLYAAMEVRKIIQSGPCSIFYVCEGVAEARGLSVQSVYDAVANLCPEFQGLLLVGGAIDRKKFQPKLDDSLPFQDYLSLAEALSRGEDIDERLVSVMRSRHRLKPERAS